MKSIAFFTIMLLAAAGYGQSTLDSGLVAFFPFCGDAVDHSGNNNNGAVHGGLTYVEDRAGKENSAANFDGISGYVLVPHSVGLDTLTDNMTLACSFYTKSYAQLWASLLSKSVYSPALRQYSIIYDKNGVLSFGHTGVASEPLDLNRWYHIAITCRDSLVRFYVDGNFIDSTYLTAAIQQTTSPLNIGRDPHIAMEYHHGMIDDVRVYNRALSKEEVSALSSFNFDCNAIATHSTDEVLGIRIYPNPTDDILIIESDLWRADGRLELYDALGKRVMETTWETRKSTLGMSALDSGVYFLKIETTNGWTTRRVLKM